MKRIILIYIFLVLILVAIPPYFTNNQILLYLPIVIVFIILFFQLVKSFPFNEISAEFSKDRIGSFKNIIEIFALCFAGFFFLFHFVANLDITDLSLEVTTKRQKVDSSQNATYLVVDVKLSKGSIASADLHTLKAYLYNIDSSNVLDSIIFHGYEKVQISPNEDYLENPNVTYTAHSDSINKKEKYTLAANESTQFSSCKLVKDNNPYRVEVIVITRRTKLLHRVNSQYRASAISLPILETEN